VHVKRQGMHIGRGCLSSSLHRPHRTARRCVPRRCKSGSEGDDGSRSRSRLGRRRRYRAVSVEPRDGAFSTRAGVPGNKTSVPPVDQRLHVTVRLEMMGDDRPMKEVALWFRKVMQVVLLNLLELTHHIDDGSIVLLTCSLAVRRITRRVLYWPFLYRYLLTYTNYPESTWKLHSYYPKGEKYIV
jgi:hypothetical protein